MKAMIKDRLTSTKVERHDLFSNFLEANDMDEGVLTDDEVIGTLSIICVMKKRNSFYTSEHLHISPCRTRG